MVRWSTDKGYRWKYFKYVYIVWGEVMGMK